MTSFREIAGKIVWQTHESKRYRHLVYFPKARHGHIIETFKDGFSIDYVGFLVDESEKSMDLAAAYMFTETKCRVLQLVNINRFDGRVMRWHSDSFYPQKYKNFHGCIMTKFKLLPRKDMIFDLALDVIASELNFDLRSKRVDLKVKMTFKKFRALGLFDFYQILPDIGDEGYVFTGVFQSAEVFFLVPPGEPLTSIEKLLSPFDKTTWMLILSTLVGIFTIIQIIGLAPRVVRNFVFGRNSYSPSMNLLSVFLCGSQPQQPRRNFSRFMLALTIIWCLIFRTAYQSLAYRNLQLDMRHPALKTAEELAENHFTQLVWSIPKNNPDDVWRQR